MSKILFVSYDLAGKGGIESVSKKLTYLLDENKCNSEFIFIRDKNSNSIIDDLWLQNIKFNRITSNITNTKLRRLHFSFLLAKYLRKNKFDAIVGLCPLSCYIVNLSKKFSLTKTPLFSWIHGALQYQYKKEYLKKADKHLAISSSIANGLIDIGINKKDISIIFNPVTKQDTIIKRPESTSNFLYIGRMDNNQKNINELIYALSNLKEEWHLDFIGDGPDKDAIQQLAEEKEINDRITWHGWKKDPWHFVINNIHGVTALILTSKYEGFPMILGEALSRGIYCISSNCDSGPEDIIKDNINGQMYTPGNISELSIKLKNLTYETLPTHEEIKNSINNFYDDVYIDRLIKALFS
ncbi:glycosyltransferase [Proteus sp. TJ1640]|uniref:glycosyltransferase n=1 Tax=Proteus sp. TJ1640 TaxID=2050968 RepID=UPI000D690A72|nr:glycosyltransferase [Proteus sp. TJ1640]